jgi:hypothetical protein
LTYPWRRAETLAALLDRPRDLLERWDAMTRNRRVVALAGADARANLGLGRSHPQGDRSPLSVPAYEQSFRTFSISLPGLQLTRDADADAGKIVAALRAGRAYSSIDAFAGPARLEFTAVSGPNAAVAGEELSLGGPLSLNVRSNAPSDAEVVLYRDGREVARTTGPSLTFDAPRERAAYRVEIHLSARQRVPWLVSNPIYVDGASVSEVAAAETIDTQMVYSDGDPAEGWGIENSPAANGVLDVVPTLKGSRLRVRYALAGSTADSAYVTLGVPAGTGLEQHDRVLFRAQADKPMRVWFQLRMPGAQGDRHWRRSVYLDDTEREITIPVTELVGVEGPSTKLLLDRIRSLMFVVDRTHTPLGQGGSFWIDEIRYGRPR